MLSKTPALKAHWPLALLLALFTVLTVYQSTTLPLGEADDETDHYQYLQFVARAGHPPLTDAERDEAGFKGGLAPLYYVLTAWPIAVVGADTPPEVRRVDARPQRHIPTDGLGINHVLHTLDEQRPWRGQPLAWHLTRLLSLPMGLVTIIVTYLLALRLCPRRRWLALTAAGFVALLPRFVFSSAVINDDNLVFALTALLLLVQVIILQNPRPPSAWLTAAIGALFGLALVTKYFSLILLPEIALTVGVVSYRAAKSPAEMRRLIAPLLAFFLALCLTAGVWFAFIILRFNRVAELGWLAGLAAALGEPQITEGLVGLLAGHSVRPPAATYPLPEWFSLLYRSFWFEFGWMRVLAPTWVYAMFSGAALLAAAGLIGKALVYPKNTRAAIAANRSVFSLLALHVLLFAIVLLARYILSATIDTGQGRHLFSALPVIALAFALGLTGLAALTDTLLHRWAAIGVTACAALLFLIPALVTLAPSATFRPASAGENAPLAALHSRFVSPWYYTHPVTIEPPPPSIHLEFTLGLSLRGLTAPDTVAAGSALPVTLTWRAEAESELDFLVSVCLKYGGATPVGCWQGHFEDGAYPARAWEAGDTLIDTVFVPIPACAPAMSEPGRIELTVWALEPISPAPQVIEPPRLRHTFDAPAVAVTPANVPPDAALWLAGQRLTDSAQAGLRQTLTRLDDGAGGPLIGPNGAIWPPQASAEVAPGCGWSSFIVNPALPNGDYRAAGLPDVTLSQRERVLAPAQGRVTFGETVAPLTLAAPGVSLDLNQPPGGTRIDHVPGQPLPVTVRWQARRWMGQPLVLALRLVDKDFAAGGERLATLGDRYPQRAVGAHRTSGRNLSGGGGGGRAARPVSAGNGADPAGQIAAGWLRAAAGAGRRPGGGR